MSAGADPRLREGIALYNHRRFFECHEVLEQLWLQTRPPEKDFYKGLIQAAVAFHHWSKGNLPGAKTLARSAAGYLKRYPSDYLGVDVEGFLGQFAELFQWLRRHRQAYDAHLVPAIQWATPGRLSAVPAPPARRRHPTPRKRQPLRKRR